MIRFVVISSMKRGAIEPGRVLSDANQRAAIGSYERELVGIGEIVVWRGAEPRIAPAGYRPQRTEKVPSVSAELRKQIRGLDNDNALQRWRVGTAKGNE